MLDSSQSTRTHEELRIPSHGKGRLAPCFTRENWPNRWLKRQVAAPIQTICICGCDRALIEATQVMVPTLGYAIDHQHAGIACAKFTAELKAAAAKR